MAEQSADGEKSANSVFLSWAKLANAETDTSKRPSAKSPPNSPAEDAPPKKRGGGVQKTDQMVEEQVADMKANRGLRETHADRAYEIAQGSICAWWVMIALSGIIKAVTDKDMWSDKVMIAVTTAVTVSVLAAFLGVIRGLFPNGNNAKAK